MLIVTWEGKNQDLEPGSSMEISHKVIVTRKLDGLIILSRSFCCTKYKQRNSWANPSVPEVTFECEWTNQFKIREGMVDFEIHGQHLVFEVVKE